MLIQKALDMKVDGKKINNTVKVLKHGQKDLNMRVNMY